MNHVRPNRALRFGRLRPPLPRRRARFWRGRCWLNLPRQNGFCATGRWRRRHRPRPPRGGDRHRSNPGKKALFRFRCHLSMRSARFPKAHREERSGHAPNASCAATPNRAARPPFLRFDRERWSRDLRPKPCWSAARRFVVRQGFGRNARNGVPIRRPMARAFGCWREPKREWNSDSPGNRCANHCAAHAGRYAAHRFGCDLRARARLRLCVLWKASRNGAYPVGASRANCPADRDARMFGALSRCFERFRGACRLFEALASEQSPNLFSWLRPASLSVLTLLQPAQRSEWQPAI